MEIFQSNGIGIFLKGGPLMWPVLLCSAIAVTIIVERLLCFQAAVLGVRQLKSDVFALLKKDLLREALNRCEANASPIARIFKAAILKFGATREEIKAAVQETAEIEIPELSKNFPALATIAHTATLLGLLGTVLGMCRVFYSIEQRASAMNPIFISDISGGIWEALLTTAAGLLVAIPTFIAYNYLANRVNMLVKDMEQSGTEIANLLCQVSNDQQNQIP